MKRITLEQKIRATGVSRWHIVRTLVPQSLADHAYSVAMIADTALMMFCNTYMSPAVAVHMYKHCRSKLIDKALHHDSLEVVTGDMPSPYKQWSEHMFGKRPTEPLHLGFFDSNAAKVEQDSVIAIELDAILDILCDGLVKLCDRIESYHFIDRYAADAHGRLVADRLELSIHNANSWMGVCYLCVPAITRLAKANEDGGKFYCVSPTERDMARKYAVDWAGFAMKIIEALRETPQEISDDDSLAGG